LFVLIISGWIYYLFPRLNFIFIVLLSMISGSLYIAIYEVPQFELFAVIFNGIISLLSFGFVKLIFYAIHKADDISKND